ncbi:hypothetical protein ACLESD_18725 [Pyxidicoccus sp. 3LFB2]
MHRIAPRATGPYRVVFTPQTWKEIGLMPTALFDAFQGAVDELAEKCGRSVEPASEEPRRQRLTLEVLVVTYERDDAARVITLVDISRTPRPSP